MNTHKQQPLACYLETFLATKYAIWVLHDTSIYLVILLLYKFFKRCFAVGSNGHFKAPMAITVNKALSVAKLYKYGSNLGY